MYLPEEWEENQEEVFMNTNFETITYEVKENIGYLTINRESALNALNSQVLNELKLLLTDIKSTHSFEVKGIILTGAGEKAFIAGADIKEMSDMTVEQAKDFGALGQRVTTLFEELHIPVIACVNGFALGGGCEMAMSCDFIYATDSAVFGQPEVKLGLIPGFGGTQRLSRYIGRNRAREIVYTGRNIKAAEAYRVGLAVQTFTTKEEMVAFAEKTISKVAQMSPLAVSTAKKVMNDGNDLTIQQGLTCELDQFASIFGSDDMKEGTKAFMEKRNAVFTGK
tara:strand:- start:42793 stop:43635 length:843 start_codon:yes stop_codon:yes gene_type:complete